MLVLHCLLHTPAMQGKLIAYLIFVETDQRISRTNLKARSLSFLVFGNSLKKVKKSQWKVILKKMEPDPHMEHTDCFVQGLD